MNPEKLTAYALNELPLDERAELEALIKNDPELHQQAEEMKAFCILLDDQVSIDEEDTLTGSQRQSVLQAFQKEHKIIHPFWKHPVFVSTTALAACIAAAFVLTYTPTATVTEYVQNNADTTNVTITKAKRQVAATDELKSIQVLKAVTVDDKALTEKDIKLPAPSAMPTLPLNTSKPSIAIGNATSSKDAGMGIGSGSNKGQDGRFADANSTASSVSLPDSPVKKATEPTNALRRKSDKQSVDYLAGGGVSLSNGKTVQPAIPGQRAMPRLNTFDNYDMPEIPSRRARGGFLDDVIVDADKSTAPHDPTTNETYAPINENTFISVTQAPLSTFSIDVDTASYANVRRFLNQGQRPPANAVRLEELINYFPYPSYEPPADDKPFAVHVDMAEAPWNPTHRLARIALKGRVSKQDRGAANFVFLVDISGSMDQPDKLPLVKQSLQMLTEQLEENDRVAIVTYAGQSGVALKSTTGAQKSRIIEAINNLHSGGSTNGASGIRLAYEQATQHFQQEGVNRVILCTDGDFNVGISNPDELEKLIKEKAKSKVFLSVLGFGTGNLKDHTMESLADKGNGNYAYIDSLSESRKVLVEQMGATLVTIAKDVKIQVEFNPAQVQAYRLLGYENRVMAKEDFNNDRKDAGEIGAGHTVTALYEIVPTNIKFPDGHSIVDDLKYATKPALPVAAPSDTPAPSSETMTVKLRYKTIDSDKSDLLQFPFTDKGKKLTDAPRDFQFATSLAGFGMLLRDSQHTGELTWDTVRKLAISGKGEDELGYRGEFIQLIEKARGLTGQTKERE